MVFNKKYAAFVAALFSLSKIANAQPFSGEATFYDTGLGNCGAWSQNGDFIAALSTDQYAQGAHCWQHIAVTYQGTTIDVTVVDSCPGCAKYDVDLSPAAFQALAPLDTGRIPVTWNWV